MKKAYIPKKIRREVFERARGMCEYCLSKSDLLGMDLEIEHIIPESLGGTSSIDNLCACCLIASQARNLRFVIDIKVIGYGRLTRIQGEERACFTRANNNGIDIFAGVKLVP